jgi:hypothetical protein
MKILMLNYVILGGQLIRSQLQEIPSVELMNIWHRKWFFKNLMITE